MFSLKPHLASRIFLSKNIVSRGNFSNLIADNIILQHRILPLLTFKSNFLVKTFCTTRRMECCGDGCGPAFSKEELKQRLTPQQYQITQEKDTERPYSGKYNKHFEKGTYSCIVCNQDLFSSDSKYDSKCGWPAFFDTISNTCVKFKDDFSHISCNLLLLTMKTDRKRTEVLCSKCGAHLGHVFDDGPEPTGKRYCINSAALDFKKHDESS